MNRIESGMRTIDGVNVVPIDGLWEAVANSSSEDKMHSAMRYAGVEFHDHEGRFVSRSAISLLGIGGEPMASVTESDSQIRQRLQASVKGSHEIMATSAWFSYLNNGNLAREELFEKVTNLGHLSIAHTVSANILLAGISEAAELEVNLQRDILHISKLTNARTKVQNRPPIVVRNPEHLEAARAIDKLAQQAIESARLTNDPDELEVLNAFYPVNKATLMMLTGSLNSLRKFTQLRNDQGKERELRDIADGLNNQLELLWPQIFKERDNK